MSPNLAIRDLTFTPRARRTLIRAAHATLRRHMSAVRQMEVTLDHRDGDYECQALTILNDGAVLATDSRGAELTDVVTDCFATVSLAISRQPSLRTLNRPGRGHRLNSPIAA